MNCFTLSPVDFVLLTTRKGDENKQWLQLLPGNNWTYLQVAGSVVNITLRSHHKDTPKEYVITLGEQNDHVALWSDSQMLQSAPAPNLMDPQELREFWLSWKSGRIQFGKGCFRGHSVIIDFVDDSSRGVTWIGLSAGSKAEWKVLMDQGK